MPLVLAVEPDTRQAAIVRRLMHEEVRADLTLVDSKDAAVAAIDQRMPDLILLTALMSPRDEAELVSHLRMRETPPHLQTLTIPLLASPAEPEEEQPTGLLSSLKRRRKKAPRAPAGCDPHVFAQEILGYLQHVAGPWPPVSEDVKPEIPAAVVPSEPVTVAEREPAAIAEPQDDWAFERDTAPIVEPEAHAVRESEPVAIGDVETLAVIEPERSAISEPDVPGVVESEPAAFAEPESIPIVARTAIADVEDIDVVEPEPVAIAEFESIPIVERTAVADVEDIDVVEPEPPAMAEPESIPIVERAAIADVEDIDVIEPEPLAMAEPESIPIVERAAIADVEDIDVIEPEAVAIADAEGIGINELDRGLLIESVSTVPLLEAAHEPLEVDSIQVEAAAVPSVEAPLALETFSPAETPALHTTPVEEVEQALALSTTNVAPVVVDPLVEVNQVAVDAADHVAELPVEDVALPEVAVESLVVEGEIVDEPVAEPPTPPAAPVTDDFWPQLEIVEEPIVEVAPPSVNQLEDDWLETALATLTRDLHRPFPQPALRPPSPASAPPAVKPPVEPGPTVAAAAAPRLNATRTPRPARRTKRRKSQRTAASAPNPRALPLSMWVRANPPLEPSAESTAYALDALLRGLRVPQSVAAVEYARGCRIGRVRLRKKKRSARQKEKGAPVIVISARLLARNGGDAGRDVPA